MPIAAMLQKKIEEFLWNSTFLNSDILFPKPFSLTIELIYWPLV